jgi:hypothetical protein
MFCGGAQNACFDGNFEKRKTMPNISDPEWLLW